MRIADARWIGLDVGATKILGVAWDESGGVCARARCATERDEGSAAVLARCVELVRALAAEHAPAGLGVGFAGLVDARSGRVASSIMLPGWSDVPLAAVLAEELQLRCHAENDANAAVYGEWVALGRPRALNLVVVTVGTGIGGGLVLDGRLYRGSAGLAGEFGNTTVELFGPTCWCGARGCLNALASGTALSTRYAALVQTDELVSVAELGRRARAGDASAARVIADGARALGAGLANLINLLNPARIALCGGVTELGEEWLGLVRAEAEARAFAESRAAVRIERAVLGSDSGAVGAAALARDRFGPDGARAEG